MITRFLSGLVATKALQKAASKSVDIALTKAVDRRRPHRSTAHKTMGAVPGAVIGAVVMFLLDPKMGHSRRAEMVQRLRGMMPSSKDVSKKATHLQNVSKGAAISTLHKVRPGQNGDSIVKNARSVLSEVVEETSNIRLEVQDGRLVVSGQIDRTHVDAVREALKGLPGVTGVEDRLDIRETTDHSQN